jgi:(p)ppGpp synthase/HD superfamily hydrolase
VRLADRADNLRDLRNSPAADRSTRFLAALTETYLPLAKAARHHSAHHWAAHDVLAEEYHRHRRIQQQEGAA